MLTFYRVDPLLIVDGGRHDTVRSGSLNSLDRILDNLGSLSEE